MILSNGILSNFITGFVPVIFFVLSSDTLQIFLRTRCRSSSGHAADLPPDTVQVFPCRFRSSPERRSSPRRLSSPFAAGFVAVGGAY